MLANFRQNIVARTERRLYYGWVMVAVASLGIFTSGAGQSHTFSVFFPEIERDLGLSRTELSSAYGTATLVAAFLLPQMGRLIDRYGARRMLTINVALLGLTCALFAAVPGLVWLAVGFGALRFLGQGSMMLGCANVVSQWFTKRRGLALGLMAAGFGVSMAIHPPLGELLIHEIGWRRAWMVMGLLTWVLMLPPILLLLHNRPEDVGLRPEHEAPRETGEAAAETEPQIPGLTLAEALRTPSFYLLSFGWFAMAMLVTTIHVWFVTVLEAQGIAKEIAAGFFPITAITMVAMMPVVGRLLDKIKTRLVFAGGLLITAGSLVSWTLATDVASAVVFAVIFGVNNAFTMTMFGFLWPRYFGRRHLGSIQGTGQMIGVVGASLGALPVGIAYDLLGDATWTIRLLALYPVLAAVLGLLFLRTHPAVLAGHEHQE